MAVQPTFMLIADIGGYTRFMKMHRTSLAHAHDIIARLIETVIDAASRRLTLAKLEGDAAFFYAPIAGSREADLTFLADQIASMHFAFHKRVKNMCAGNLCDCPACEQTGNLRLKFAGHLGEAAVHKVKRMTELAGVDVILVHRLLKNSVPVPEYLLMTEPVLKRLDEPLRTHAAPHPMEIDDIGKIETYFIDLQHIAREAPVVQRPVFMKRVGSLMAMALRTTPFMLGLRKPCCGCHNVPMN